MLYLLLFKTLKIKYYYFHFVDKETEALRGLVIYLRLHSLYSVELGSIQDCVTETPFQLYYSVSKKVRYHALSSPTESNVFNLFFPFWEIWSLRFIVDLAT